MKQCSYCRSTFSVVGLNQNEQFERSHFCKHKEKWDEPMYNHGDGECAEFIGTHEYLRSQKRRAKKHITWRNSRWHKDYSNALVNLGVKSLSAAKKKKRKVVKQHIVFGKQARAMINRTRIPGTNIRVPDIVARMGVVLGVGVFLYANWLLTSLVGIISEVDWSMGMVTLISIPMLIVTINLGALLWLVGLILYALFWKFPRWLIWGIK